MESYSACLMGNQVWGDRFVAFCCHAESIVPTHTFFLLSCLMIFFPAQRKSTWTYPTPTIQKFMGKCQFPVTLPLNIDDVFPGRVTGLRGRFATHGRNFRANSLRLQVAKWATEAWPPLTGQAPWCSFCLLVVLMDYLVRFWLISMCCVE